jgi:hypothetical protein
VKLFAFIGAALVVSIIWAVSMLGTGICFLLYSLNNFDAAFLPYLIGFILVWFGAVALSGALGRISFDYGTTHGSL